MTNPASENPIGLIGPWAWRLLPLFAFIAAAAVWNAWSTAAENEMAVRAAMKTHAAEWRFVKLVTGKTLGKL